MWPRAPRVSPAHRRVPHARPLAIQARAFESRAVRRGGQLRFLAGVNGETKREDAKAALLRGLEWLFAALYPNGGWPQNCPVEPGYHEAITLNDDAMIVRYFLALVAAL